MSTHKYIDKICCAVVIVALIITALFMNAEFFGVTESAKTKEYESRLFDTSTVHTIDIVMDDWDEFVENCADEEYVNCSVVIDNETYNNVAIRAKGNTSLTQVESYGNNRYSFKLEFDHYDSTKNYYGLDKLSLNNIIQDNTYMKEYLTYQMMHSIDADAPLCSYVNITVNGENWGLYLALESVEDSYLERNYGSDYGELYKSESMSEGGGQGAGGEGSDDVKLVYSDDEYDSYANIFDNAKTDITDTDKDRLIEALKQLNSGENIEDVVDVESVIKYFVVHNFVCNFDSYTGTMIHNYYLYEEDGKLSMIPWDYNLAFGGFQDVKDANTLVNYPIDTPVSGETVDSRPMLAWIFSNEEYTELYHKYFAEFISTYFDSGEFSETIDSVESMISSFVEEDSTKFCTYEEFQTGVETLKEFCSLRAESVSGQLDGTIASTSEGQSQDSSSLVDASNINVSDMGSMGNGNGGGNKDNAMEGMQEGMQGGMQEGTEPPEMPQNQQSEQQSDQQSEQQNESTQPPEMPDGEQTQPSEGEQMQPPDGEQAGEQAQLPDGEQAQLPDGEQAQLPDGEQAQQPGENNAGETQNDTQGEVKTVDVGVWIVLGVSVLVLAAAILIAKFYKKYS